ncbi:IS5 family transposase [bacterium]|nr:IS5 family transposase [bacterium]
MKSKATPTNQRSFLMPGLAEQCDPRQSIKKLADAIPWKTFENAFASLYSNTGRPAKPVRLMVGLLLLKQLENLSDEVVVERWTQNIYYQYFCGMSDFQWSMPCDPTDLVYFRERIGEEGVHLILSVTANMHPENLKEKEIVVDTTVQEKNITHPTDTKLLIKIIERCWKLANQYGIQLRRTFKKEVKKLKMSQRWYRHPGKAKLARKGRRRLRTVAGILLRDLHRKLPGDVVKAHLEDFMIYWRVLLQKRTDKNKIYSLHEPQVYCVAKGKEHKKYEFGSKGSVAITAESGIIVSAVAHPKNIYDGHTLPEVLELAEAVMGQRPTVAIADRGYRGVNEINGTTILTPKPGDKDASKTEKEKMKHRFRRRSVVEAVIGHLKADFRLMRCYLKGTIGDQINLLLAASAWNLKKWVNTLSFFRVWSLITRSIKVNDEAFLLFLFTPSLLSRVKIN